jgi:tight adherence protein B
MREILVVLCSLAIVAALEGGRQMLRWAQERRHAELRRRLQDLGRGSSADNPSLLRRRPLSVVPGLDAALRRIALARKLDRLLEQTDARYTVAQILAASAGGAGVVAVSAALARLGWMSAALLSLLALVAPSFALVVARDRRSRRMSEQLPEALDMMARSLRAGHALSASLEVVAREMPEPVAVEFGRAFEAQRLGLPLEQAIVQMTGRLPGNGDVKIFAVSTLIQRETGGNLAEILSNLAETIRARYRFYGKLRALTAEGRASAVIVAVMPFLVVLALRAVNPGFMNPLFSDALGHMFLAYAIVSWCVGVAWLYRMAQVDF